MRLYPTTLACTLYETQFKFMYQEVERTTQRKTKRSYFLCRLPDGEFWHI